MSKDITFTEQDRRENKCSIHEDVDTMRDQKTRLGQDMLATLDKDQEAAYLEKLGKIPRDSQMRKHGRVDTITPESGPEVYVCYYRRKPICAYTAPIPRTKGFHYILRWYFKAL